LPYIQSDGYFIRYQNQLAHDPGTPNALGAVSMAVALQKLSSIGVENIEAYEKRLSDYVYDQLSVIPKVTLYVKKSFLSSIITFNIDGFTAQQTADILNNEYGIGTRAGNFCVYHVVRKLLNVQNEKTLVQLVKSGHPELLPGVVRASFGLCNTMSDAKTFVHAVKELSERATK
jgi:cysteine desulfurase